MTRSRWLPAHPGRLAATAFTTMVVLAAVMLLVPAEGAAAKSAAQTPNSGEIWHVEQKLQNDSPYTFRLLQTTLTEETSWQRDPAQTIYPHQTALTEFRNGITGHGLASLLVYGVYRPNSDELVGVFVARSGVNCVTGIPWVGCVNYQRFEQAQVDRGGALTALWTDNSGAPTHFVTHIVIKPSGKGSSVNGPADWASPFTDNGPDRGPPKLVPWGLSVFRLENGSRLPFGSMRRGAQRGRMS